jgi:hypothetical protein
MFGIKPTITVQSLYLLSDMVDNQLDDIILEIGCCSEKDTERIAALEKQYSDLEEELNSFIKDVNEQLEEKFQFSVEELYSMYGQYDKFISVEFHKYSESAKKYGRLISGVIQYTKLERDALEQSIRQEKVPRTNGPVIIDCNSDVDLSEDDKNRIIKEGFKSGDVYQVLASNLPSLKSYNQKGKKEIPHTINIEFDPTGFDPFLASLWLLNQRINDGGLLIEEEWFKYCGQSLYYEPNSKNLEIIKQRAFDKNGSTISAVRFYELQAKVFNKDVSKEEINEFNELLKARRLSRIELIKKEIQRSANKSLEQFVKDYPDIYAEIYKSIFQFETESLVYSKTITPIYWNYEGFLHIFLRHCKELGIEGNFEEKTNFQYSLKDIKRILKIAVEDLAPKINESLKAGKDFRIKGERSLYFNGNHYAIHILSDGRVSTFYPIDNPEQEAK